jgi:hypothetical protein
MSSDDVFEEAFGEQDVSAAEELEEPENLEELKESGGLETIEELEEPEDESAAEAFEEKVFEITPKEVDREAQIEIQRKTKGKETKRRL